MSAADYDFSDTGTAGLLSGLVDGVLTLTLNSPATRNALTLDMAKALGQQLSLAEQAPAVRCIVLTGAGNAFCSGGDVKGMAGGAFAASTMTIDESIHRLRTLQRATAGKLFTMPKPTIAVLPGAAAGAGLSLALACDLRVMSTTAILTTAFSRVGLSGDYGGSFFLTRIVGSAKARELYYFAERISAQEALGIGLVNWVCEPQDLSARSLEIALRLAKGPPIAYRYMKENLNRAAAGGVDECMDLEATHQIHCGQTQDHREAAHAFVEKRDPLLQGR